MSLRRFFRTRRCRNLPTCAFRRPKGFAARLARPATSPVSLRRGAQGTKSRPVPRRESMRSIRSRRLKTHFSVYEPSPSINMRHVFPAASANALLQFFDGFCPPSFDVRRIALLDAPQYRLVLPLNHLSVSIDVVECCLNLFAGKVQFSGDPVGRTSFTDKIHDPIDGNSRPTDLGSSAAIDDSCVHVTVLPFRNRPVSPRLSSHFIVGRM